MRSFILFSFLLGVTVAVVVQGGGRRRGKFSSSSESSKSSSEEHEHHHGRGHGRSPRPPYRPRPLRPNPAPRNECDAGWLRFERPNNVIWCIYIGVPGVTNGYLSQTDAQTACAGFGATLTGFQNDNERMTVANEAFKRLTNIGGLVAGLWLGATNLPGCRSPSCGPYTTFQWTDGYTTGVAGLKWGVGEPDNNNWPGNTACIQQFIISPNFMAGPNDFQAWKAAFVNGDLDKYQCNSPAYPYTRMYACGKLGVRR